MIVDSKSHAAVSNLGWVDRGSIWVCNFDDSTPSRVELSDAKYLKVYPGGDDHFSLVHHFDSDRLTVTVHTFVDVGTPIAKVEIVPSNSSTSMGQDTAASIAATFSGDMAAWAFVPRAYVAYAFGFFHLVLIDRSMRRVEIQKFPWFDSTYDHLYQGIIDVLQVPESEQLIISVQRDSDPVLYDPVKGKVLRKIPLANRRGNPKLMFRRKAAQLWASDYYTLVCVSLADWNVLRVVRIQSETSDGTNQFMGEYFLDPGEKVCIVARPFSKDIVQVSPEDFRIMQTIPTGRQPLDVGLLAGELIVARDWKTGDFITGRLSL